MASDSVEMSLVMLPHACTHKVSNGRGLSCEAKKCPEVWSVNFQPTTSPSLAFVGTSDDPIQVFVRGLTTLTTSPQPGRLTVDPSAQTHAPASCPEK